MKSISIVFCLLCLSLSIAAQPLEQNYPSGAKKSFENYKNGMQEGRSTFWYENGKIAKEGDYKNGKEEGKWSFYYENGKPKAEENYRWGKKNGAANVLVSGANPCATMGSATISRTRQRGFRLA